MNIQAVSDAVAASPDLQAKMAQDPAATLQVMSAAVQAMPLATDVWIYRVIVGSMSFALVSAVIGAMILSAYARPVPESVIALGSAALAALALLLRPQVEKA